MIEVSVVVCTRNRAAQLEAALASYQRLQTMPHWELVVVDNGSTDGTPDVIDRFAAESRCPVRHVFEPRTGLALARNRGTRAARGEVIAFTDDDCYPDPEYITVLRRLFTDTPYDYAAGQVLLHDPQDDPVSIQEHDAAYTIPLGSYIAPGQMLGANVAIRRSGLIGLRGFDERLGAGTFFRSGEDTDLLRRASRSGMLGRYDPALKIYHHHGRRGGQTEALKAGYERGVGAGLAKFACQRETRLEYLRRAYWRIRRAPLASAMRLMCFALLFVLRYGTSVSHHPASGLENPGLDG